MLGEGRSASQGGKRTWEGKEGNRGECKRKCRKKGARRAEEKKALGR